MRKHAALAVLALAVCGAFADDPPASAPASAPVKPKLATLAAQQKDTLERLTDLRFDLQVLEESLKPNGGVVPRAEVVRAKVVMMPGRIRTEVYRGADREPIFVLVDDGKNVTEWTPEEWCEYPSPPPEVSRSVALGDAFPFGCYIGTCLRSWLGPHGDRGAWIESVILKSRYEGTEELDGNLCDVLLHERIETDGFLVSHRLWIDRKQEFIVKWATRQAQLWKAGKVASEIVRTRVYQNISREKVALEVFVARPPKTAVRRGTTSQPSSQPTTNVANDPSASAALMD